MLDVPPCDSAVWLANGLPGIVIGSGHGSVTVLWSNGRKTTLPASLIIHHQPCPPGTDIPPPWK